MRHDTTAVNSSVIKTRCHVDEELIITHLIKRAERSWPILFAICLGVTACSGNKGEVSEPVRPAKLYTVKASSERFDTSYPAILEAEKSSVLTFQVAGLLKSLPVREGQAVRKGAVLARLDQRRYQNAFNAAQAQYASAQSEYLSASKLLEQDAIARIAVDQRRAQRDVARAQLDSARKDLDDTVLRAPFSGIIAQRHATQFENVQPKEDIVTIQSQGRIDAVISVPASIVAQLDGKNSSKPHIVLNAAPNIKIPGTFRSATTQGDTQSQTFQVKFAFSPPAGLVVLPGMTATVFSSRTLIGEQAKSTQISIPLGAILSDGKNRYVWVVDTKTMKVKKRAVKTDAGASEEIALLSGLKLGETIVAAGAAYLHDGMKIRPYQP